MPINSYSQILYKCCSEGSLFVVKVLCLQRRFTAEPSIMQPAKPSSNPSSEPSFCVLVLAVVGIILGVLVF